MSMTNLSSIPSVYVEIEVVRGSGARLLMFSEPDRPDILTILAEMVSERRKSGAIDADKFLVSGAPKGTFRIFRDGTVQCDPEVKHDFAVELARRWKRKREGGAEGMRNGTTG